MDATTTTYLPDLNMAFLGGLNVDPALLHATVLQRVPKNYTSPTLVSFLTRRLGAFLEEASKPYHLMDECPRKYLLAFITNSYFPLLDEMTTFLMRCQDAGLLSKVPPTKTYLLSFHMADTRLCWRIQECRSGIFARTRRAGVSSDIVFLKGASRTTAHFVVINLHP